MPFWALMTIAFVILAALIAIPLVVKVYAAKRIARDARNVYACPNCGYRFQGEWQSFFFDQLRRRWPSFTPEPKMIFKCPKCNKRDVCSFPWNMTNT